MVESVHQIGQAMGLKTVAEWVEDQASLEMLSDIGLDFAQGFGIAVPKPFETDGHRPDRGHAAHGLGGQIPT